MKENNQIIKKALNSFKFTLIAQIIVLILSIIKSLLLPKILPINDYGYWQIYVLYSTYVGLFALGYNDGIYLIYGKYQYEELPFKRLRTANKIYIAMLTFFSITACLVCLFIQDNNRQFSMLGVSLDIILMGINGLFIYILQITNQMKAYSFFSVLDKFVLLFSVVLICILPYKDFHIVVFADVFSRAVVSISLIYKCRKLIFGSTCQKSIGWNEFINNIKTGINLMIANLMGMFVTGIGRFIVDYAGNIEQYAFYSFGITITNLVLVFITAVSLVLYPTLKRMSEKYYCVYFKKLNFGVLLFNYIALFSYFPAVIIIHYFLPHYLPILDYLHFLFGVIILQSKMQLINNTFYKVLRKEKSMLKANINCVILFLFIALFSFTITKQISSIAICTFIAMLFRCYASEIYLRNTMNISIPKSMWKEIVYLILYVLIISFFELYISFFLYSVLFILFIFSNFHKIKKLNRGL